MPDKKPNRHACDVADRQNFIDCDTSSAITENHRPAQAPKSWRDVLPVHPAAEKLLNRYLVTMRREGRFYCVTVKKPSLWQGHVPPSEHFGPMPYAEANKIYRTAKLKGALSALGITDIRAEDLERKHSRMVDAVRALTNARKPLDGGAR